MVGFGHRIGRTLRVPGRGLRRIGRPAGRPGDGGARPGSAVALTTPSVIAALHPTPVADAQPALPRLALGPLVATAPMPTQAGLTTALGKPAGRRAGHVHRRRAATRRRTRCSGSARPATRSCPARPAKLITTAAALLTLNPTSSLVTKVVAGGQPGAVVLVGGGDPTLTALPPGKATVYPDPARLAELADQVKKATGGRITKVMIDTSPLPRAGPRAGLGRGRHRGRATSPRSAR